MSIQRSTIKGLATTKVRFSNVLLMGKNTDYSKMSSVAGLSRTLVLSILLTVAFWISDVLETPGACSVNQKNGEKKRLSQRKEQDHRTIPAWICVSTYKALFHFAQESSKVFCSFFFGNVLHELLFTRTTLSPARDLCDLHVTSTLPALPQLLSRI